MATSLSQPPQDRLNVLVALYNEGQWEEVIRKTTAVAAEFPNAVILHNMLGAANAALGNLDGAIASFSRAVQIKPDYAEGHNNLGLALQRRGRLAEAIASFEAALRIDADQAEAHNNLGVAFKQQGRLEEAIASLGKAVQLAPGHAEAHNNLGAALQGKGRLDEAVECFGRAVRIKPRFVEAHSNLCGIYEKQNRLDDLERALQGATRSCGTDDSNILFRLAQLASRRNRFDDALGYLQKARVEKIQPSQRGAYLNLLGKVCDNLGRFDEAFSAFERQNDLARTSLAAAKVNADRLLEQVRSCKTAWTEGEAPVWTRSMDAAARRPPAFLVGFPRSGTTLLDTILRSHARISVIEEKPMVAALVRGMSRALARRPTIRDLNGLSEKDVLALQGVYFKELQLHHDTTDGSRLIIDKFPLNIMHVDVINRVFPDAKIILALRHPCDCVLSCFMQTFKLNDAMANFLGLEQSVKLYAAVMELWSAYRERLDLDVHVLKYEDLVRDLEGTCKSLTGFLGLDWDDNMKNYQQVALDRGNIRTPSYNQVTQPLYKQASGRWLNYRQHMQPVLPMLQPWIAALGY